MKKNQTKRFITLLFATALTISTADACTRFTYDAPDNTVITGRSMDWTENMHTDLWAFPAGIARVGANSQNSISWTSKYGSLVASAYNVGVADGVNTAGLSANLLYLSTADYGKPRADRKDLSVFQWAQYVLDNYATVDEAVKGLSQAKFNMIAPRLPNGDLANVHLAITDKSGDNAIFEHINGELVIHHGKEFKVMTNEPGYDQQLALNDYWQRLNGGFLPGTSEPADRFVRASYYLNTAPETADPQQSVAIVFSVIRNVSVPMSEIVSNRPNIAATLWRSVADLKHGIYYFEETDRPNVFWTDINKLDLKPDAPTKKLPLDHNEIYVAEVSKYFIPAKPEF